MNWQERQTNKDGGQFKSRSSISHNLKLLGLSSVGMLIDSLQVHHYPSTPSFAR